MTHTVDFSNDDVTIYQAEPYREDEIYYKKQEMRILNKSRKYIIDFEIFDTKTLRYSIFSEKISGVLRTGKPTDTSPKFLSKRDRSPGFKKNRRRGKKNSDKKIRLIFYLKTPQQLA